jgi:aminocarboxymuconate-semialdehyde decarboxylase
VNDEDVSLPKYDPFWAKAAELGALVFMHPGRDQHRQGGRGTLDKFAGLRVCGAHAGGCLPSYVGRTEAACVVRPNANCANKKKPSEYLKSQAVADTMVFSDEGLRHLVAEMGVGQVVYGTDVPFNWPVTVDLVLGASFLSDADKEAILSRNLMKLLRIAG